MRRALQGADDLAKLVFRARRSGGRRRGRREPAGLRRHHAERRAFSQYAYPLGPRAGRGRGAPAPRARSDEGLLTFSNINPVPGITPVVLWRNPRIVTRARRRPSRRARRLPPRKRTRSRRTDSLHASSARRAAGRRRRRAEIRREPRRIGDRSRRLRDDPERSRSRSIRPPPETSPSSRPTPSSGAIETPWSA